MERQSRWTLRAAPHLVKATYKVCPWCSKPIGKQFDCHHWLIKRGRLPKVMFPEIDVVVNVIAVHHSCHMQYGQTKEFERRCAILASETFGPEVILKWYNSVSERTNLQPKDSLGVQ